MNINGKNFQNENSDVVTKFNLEIEADCSRQYGESIRGWIENDDDQWVGIEIDFDGTIIGTYKTYETLEDAVNDEDAFGF